MEEESSSDAVDSKPQITKSDNSIKKKQYSRNFFKNPTIYQVKY